MKVLTGVGVGGDCTGCAGARRAQRVRWECGVERCGVEVAERRVAARDPGVQRAGDDGAGRERRVRRDGETLTRATRGEDDVGPRWFVPFKRKKGCDTTPEQKRINRVLAELRSAVEHPFRCRKRQFGATKVR